MTKFYWVQVEPGSWQGMPSPHRSDAPVIDVWKNKTDPAWYFSVQQHSWRDSIDDAKRAAERMYSDWIATHPAQWDAMKERAAVVAWLRQTAGYYDMCTRKSVLLEVSHTIERGYHRRFEEAP